MFSIATLILTTMIDWGVSTDISYHIVGTQSNLCFRGHLLNLEVLAHPTPAEPIEE
jgi:hypothetical protein